jgi:hypothetical protein
MTARLPTTAATERVTRADRWLRIAAVAYAVAFVLHTGDHFRRGVTSSPWLVVLAGTLAGIAQVTAIAAVLTGRPWAPRLAAVLGLIDAAGIAAVHFVTTPTAVTDPVVGAGATGIQLATPVAVALEVATALAFGLAGLHRLRMP